MYFINGQLNGQEFYLIMWKYGAQNINIHPHIVHPWGKIIPIWKVEITFLETLKYLSPCFFQSIMMHIIRLLVRDDGWHCNQWNQIPSFCTLSVTYAMFLIKKGWIFFFLMALFTLTCTMDRTDVTSWLTTLNDCISRQSNVIILFA